MPEQQSTTRKRVLLFHSEIVPYRVPLFERLSGLCNLRVAFCMHRSRVRSWQVPKPEALRFAAVLLRSTHVGPFTINQGVSRQIAEFSPHCVIVDDDPRLTLSSLIAVRAAACSEIPIVIWSESTPNGYFGAVKYLGHRLLGFPRRYCYGRAHAFIAWGRNSVQWLQECGAGTARIRKVVHPLNSGEFADVSDAARQCARCDLGVDGKRVVLFVGHLIPRKGALLLARAFLRLKRSDAVLVMLGSGTDERRIKKLAMEQHNILLPGFVEGSTKSQWYAAADLFVLPSIVEPWGRVVGEAMAAGLPIITTNAVGASELVDGNGELVPPGDENALALALGQLLDDRNERLRMGRRSLELARELAVSRAADEIMRAIELAVSRIGENGHIS